MPNGRLFAITDIHGCVNSFQNLIDQLKLAKEDRLILLGDYINKGPYSKQVLDLIIDLMQQKLDVWPLTGNHENLLIQFHNNENKDHNQLHYYHSLGLVDEEGFLQIKYRKLLFNLIVYIKIQNMFFVHAGINFDAENPFQNLNDMIWIRKMNIPPNLDLKIVHGHVPQALDTIQYNINQNNANICLDNGCFDKFKPNYGNLIALDCTNWEMYVQKNVD